MLLANQRALITGAGRGLGRAIAGKLAAEGALVVLAGRNMEDLNRIKAEIEENGGRAECYQVDVTDHQQNLAMVSSITAAHGQIDILVNNAGISKEMPLNEMPVEVWDELYDVNLRAVMLMTKAVLPGMIGRGRGNIVNIGSGAALRGLPGSAAYSAMKAGVVALTQALGDELREHHIRVNVVCPGPVDTEMFRNSRKRQFIMQAGGDIFSPETVANGVLYLASDLSEGMSSQTLTLRGFNRW